MDIDVDSIPVPEELACDLVGLTVERGFMEIGDTDYLDLVDVTAAITETRGHLASLGRGELLQVCEALVDIAAGLAGDLAAYVPSEDVFAALRDRALAAGQRDARWAAGGCDGGLRL